MTEKQIADAIRDIDPSELEGGFHTYKNVQGKCTVWVTETLRPGEPMVKDGNITFPYTVDRPDHQYNCSGTGQNDPWTTPKTRNDIHSRVTAKYRVVDGVLQIYDICDHAGAANAEESIVGDAVVRKLRMYS